MKIKEVFERELEETIAPVIFFNQKDAITVEKEVKEYVFTSSATRSIEEGKGIHEQLHKLLAGIAKSITNQGTLPTSWISGFYGSGKSSLAKLIGLCLDDFVLPDGRKLVDVFFQRNDSGKVNELIESYKKIKELSGEKTFSIVFDIGASSKTDEHIPMVAYNELLKRLGYSQFDSIAYYEISLEEEGLYTQFGELCKTHYKDEWKNLKDQRRAKDIFSHLYHLLKPEQFKDSSSWSNTNFGRRLGRDNSIEELVRDMQKCITHRMPGYTLFIVIDEVSQYIGKDNNRMLQLQSLAQELGAKGKNKIWLLVTGQEKLEEAAKSSELFKLKDRFPEGLRVYLEPTNVKEIIRRRLLKKKPLGRRELEDKFSEGAISLLKLYAFGESGDFVKEELVDFYPLLPSYIDLILQLSNGIRARSAHAQRDTGGVRSALQISHDILNEPRTDLKNQSTGAIVNLTHIFNIVSSALDNDMKSTYPEIRKKCEDTGEDFAYDVAKCIILLEYVEGMNPVTDEKIAKLLYSSIGQESLLPKVRDGLKFLESNTFIRNTEETGWKVRGSISQDWEKEKLQIPIDAERIEGLMYDSLKNDVVPKLGSFTYQEMVFPYEFYKSDTDRLKNESAPNIKVQFQFGESGIDFIEKSKVSVTTNPQERRIFWISAPSSVERIAREVLGAEAMISRYAGKEIGLDQTRKRLLTEEKTNRETNKKRLFLEIEKSLLSGKLYCNGRSIPIPRNIQKTSEVLPSALSEVLFEIYPQLRDGLFKITSADLDAFFEKEILTARKELYEGTGFLGLVKRDQNKIVFTGSGAIPTKISNFCQIGKLGSTLLAQFSGEPYGYSPFLIKLCLLALVRAGVLQISGRNGEKFTSVLDQGFKEVFLRDMDFKNASFLPYKDDDTANPRQRNECVQFFRDYLNVSRAISTEVDVIADSIFQFFPPLQKRIRERKSEFLSLELPIDPLLETLETAVLTCMNSRFAEKVVKSMHNTLGDLREGVARLREIENQFTEETKREIQKLKNVLKYEYGQVRDIDRQGEVDEPAQAIRYHLGSAKPYADLADFSEKVEKIQTYYKKVRLELVAEKDKLYTEKEERLRNRSIFGEITIDERAEVLLPLQSSNKIISPDGVAPTLLQIEKYRVDIEEAAELSHKKLDEIYNRIGERQIVTLNIPFLSTEIKSIEELDSQLKSLRERCEQEISLGRIVRFQ